MSFRLGIIGCGAIGAEHAKAASAAGVTVAGCCDVDEAKSKALAAQYDGAVGVTSTSELFALPDVPAVVVGTPNALHAPLAIEALQAGKDVLLEKPMAMSVAECDDIIAARDAAGKIVQLGFVCRGSATSRVAKDLVDSGELGTVYHVKASMYRRRGIPGLGRWFTTKSMSGGGALIDIGVHLIDLARYLTGSATPVRASAACTSMFGSPLRDYVFEEMWAGPPRLEGVFDVDDGAVALIRFDTGLTLELNVTWAANIPEESTRDVMVLLGDRGGAAFDIWGDRVRVASERGRALSDTSIHAFNEDAWATSWAAQYRQFIATVTRTAPPHATAEDGRTIQAVLEALYASSAAQREVEIDS